MLHGLLVELDLDRVQGGGVGQTVVLDGVIGVIALVDGHFVAGLYSELNCYVGCNVFTLIVMGVYCVAGCG